MPTIHPAMTIASARIAERHPVAITQPARTSIK